MDERESFLDTLPVGRESCLNAAIEAIVAHDPIVEQWISSLEAPSAIAAVRDVFPDVIVHFEQIPDPDPRLPRRPVRTLLWRYDEERALPAATAPDTSILESVATIAVTEYSLERWSEVAAAMARNVKASSSEWASAAVHPLPRRNRIAPWDWRFGWQIASLLIALHAEEIAGRDPLGLLGDVIYGPTDWTSTSALVAVLDVARRSPSRAAEIVQFFLDLAKAPDSPVWFMCVALPALVACRDVPGIPAKLSEALDQKIAAWSE